MILNSLFFEKFLIKFVWEKSSDSNSEDDMSNAGTVNSRERHVMFDSSIPSDDSESSELSKYLDEAIDSDDTDENNDRDGEDPQVNEQ